MERPVAAVLVTALLAAGCVLLLPMAWQWARGGSQPTVDAALPVLTAADANASPVSAPPVTAGAAEALPQAGDGQQATPSPALQTAPDPTPVVVHVAGAVRTSGVVELIEPARVIDAITAAGGPSSTAALERLNLAEHVADGQRIWVPAIGDGPEVEVVPLATPRPTPGPRPAEGSIDAAPVVVGAPVAVNSATAAELETLPGIGPVMAAAIVDHRSRVGPFASVDGLLDVSGIGTVRLESLRPHIVIS